MGFGIEILEIFWDFVEGIFEGLLVYVFGGIGGIMVLLFGNFGLHNVFF